MGCSAGKHVTTSPEVSSSSHSTKENGWQPHSPDVPKHSLESSSHLIKRKDSSNSISSVKELGIPAPKNDVVFLLKNKDDHGILARKKIQPSSENMAPNQVPLNQSRTQMTQSQLEFFQMLDKKIDEGPDYVSETES